MKNELMAKASQSLGKTGLMIKKHSPEILMIVGVAGVVGAAIKACHSTLKLPAVLDEHKENLEAVHEKRETDPENYSKKDTVAVYARTGLELAKLYGPAITLGGLSVASILMSNDILRKRNAALAAAYATLDESFKKYRAGVISRFGEEVDYQLKNGIRQVEVEETVTDEKGKEKTVKKTIDVADPDASGYAKYLTRSNLNWENDSEYVEMFLRNVQNFANDKLRVKGWLTLNEVYRDLGFKETQAGMVVGWNFDEKHPTGDNFVELTAKRVFVPSEEGGYEDAYLIDFNVDGNIYNNIK